MVFFRVLLVFAASCAAAAPCATLGAEVTFAQNFLAGSKQVVTFPVGDPGNMSVVGPLADTMAGMDFDPAASVLWAIDFTTHALGTIDQGTGAFVQAKVLADTNIHAFTIDPVGGTFYVSKDDRYVYRLDPASGETTLLGTGAAVGTTINALAANCQGRLFALAGNGVDLDALYEAHLGVADATFVGSAGYSGATSLESDNRSGALYAWFNASGNTTSTYGTVDAATAAVSQTSVLSGKFRMTIRAECSIFDDGFDA